MILKLGPFRIQTEHELDHLSRPFAEVGLYAHSERDGPTGVNVTLGIGSPGIDPVVALDISFTVPVAWHERHWRTP